MTDESLARYERARRAYLRALYRPTAAERIGAILATIFQRFWLPLAFLTATTFFTIGLCAQEVPTWVLRGIAAVETGTDYREFGDVRGKWKRGAIGETGPWQLSPAVLRDLKSYDKRERVHTCVVFAESLTRAWLLHLYDKTGSWPAAVAAYHAGLGNRSASFATEYAARVRAVGSL